MYGSDALLLNAKVFSVVRYTALLCCAVLYCTLWKEFVDFEWVVKLCDTVVYDSVVSVESVVSVVTVVSV